MGIDPNLEPPKQEQRVDFSGDSQNVQSYNQNNVPVEKTGLVGFRSGKTWKKVICIIYLVLVGLVFVGSVCGGSQFDVTPNDAVISRLTGVVVAIWMLAPIVAFSSFKLYKKIPLLKSNKIGPRIAVLFIYLVVFGAIFAGINSLHSPEYDAAYEAYQAQMAAERSEQEAKKKEQREKEQAEKEASKKAEEDRKAQEEAAKQAEEESKRAEEESAKKPEGESDASGKKDEDSDQKQAATDSDTTKLYEQIKSLGYTDSEAQQIKDILVNCGITHANDMWTIMDNPPLKANALSFKGENYEYRQVNFTTDDGKLFYVQATGWKESSTGWYLNWRGKLKYGITDKKLSFDLYDSDTTPGGYLAYYDQAKDEVIPWGE